MVHKMRLLPQFFKKIETNDKTMEIRLADEKRKHCQIGDTIIFGELPFCKKHISVIIDSIDYYSSFEQLLFLNDIHNFGINEYEKDTFVKDLEYIYPSSMVDEYGLFGIRFHMLN